MRQRRKNEENIADRERARSFYGCGRPPARERDHNLQKNSLEGRRTKNPEKLLSQLKRGPHWLSNTHTRRGEKNNEKIRDSRVDRTGKTKYGG